MPFTKHQFAPALSSTPNGVKLCTKDMNAHAILPLVFMPNCDFAPVWPRLGCARRGVDRPAMARPPEMRCWGLAAGAQGQAVAAGGTGTGHAGSRAGPPVHRAEDVNAARGGAWIAHGQLSISCSGPRKREQGGSTAPGRRRELGWPVLGGGKLATARCPPSSSRTRRGRAP